MLALDSGAGQIALAVGPGRPPDRRRHRRRRPPRPAGRRGRSTPPIAPIADAAFVSVRAGEGRADVLELMRARRIGAIPVLDAAGRPVGLHLLHAFLAPVERTNRAVVMAGGQGVRLRPLTETVPKPMLRVAGRPILERIVLHLVGSGITRIYLSVNYLGDVIEDHFGDGARFGAQIEYLREDEPLGTAGALGLLAGAADRAAARDERRPRHAGRRRRPARRPRRVGRGRHDRRPALPPRRAVRLRRARRRSRGRARREADPGARGQQRHLRPRARPSSRRVRPGVPLTMPELHRGPPRATASTSAAFEIEDDWIDVGQRDQLDRAQDRWLRSRRLLRGVRCLVTGADGFIGSHLVERLVAEGAQVRAFCLYNSRGSAGWLDDLSPEARAARRRSGSATSATPGSSRRRRGTSRSSSTSPR